MLAIATYDRGYTLEHVAPAVTQVTEGSMWDLTDLDAAIVLTRDNIAPTLQINDWIRRPGQDPWRGIAAAVARGPTITIEHHALIPVQLGQTSFYLDHLFGFGISSTWHPGNTLCRQRPTINTTTTSTVIALLLGLVPLGDF